MVSASRQPAGCGRGGLRKVWCRTASEWMKESTTQRRSLGIRLGANQELIGMKLKRAPRTHLARLERLDALMDSYLHWRDESREVAESYRKWRCASRLGRDGAFDEYLAV